jgi:predicted metal-dependent peptidase
MDRETRLIKARTALVIAQPFFGSLALRLKFVEDKSVETTTCDGASIRYNPDFIDGLDRDQLVGSLAHSVMHPALLHHTRRGARDPKKWNQACDHVVNNVLASAGFKLPKGTYQNPAWADYTAEHIYTLLPDEPQDNKGQGQGQGDGQNNNAPDPGGDGGVSDSPNGQSQSERNNEEAEWKSAVAQAAYVAKQAGKLPGALERMMEEMLKPVLPWKDILRRFMTEKCNDDFSWRKGNRRFIAQGMYLPSRVSDDAMGEIVVVIDTSGSIGEKELNEFSAEIKGIVDELKPEKTVVMYCDAHVAHVDTFGRDDPLHFAAHGGGGTDFRPPFDYIAKKQMNPRCLVYLTDGYGPFPEEHTVPFPTLWCINNHDVVPPLGEHLIIDVS